MTILEIQNGSNWEVNYTDSKLVTPGNKPGTYVPIQPFRIPILFSSNIIAVKLDSVNSNPRWFLGGRLTQIIPSTGITSQEYHGKQFNCGLNRATLIIYLS